jgi:hypothetical protein
MRPSKYSAKVACPVDDCGEDTYVTLDGDRSTGQAWVIEYETTCPHDWEDLNAFEQSSVTESALEESYDHAMEQISRFDTWEEKDLFEADMGGES